MEVAFGSDIRERQAICLPMAISAQPQHPENTRAGK